MWSYRLCWCFVLKWKEFAIVLCIKLFSLVTYCLIFSLIMLLCVIIFIFKVSINLKKFVFKECQTSCKSCNYILLFNKNIDYILLPSKSTTSLLYSWNSMRSYRLCWCFIVFKSKEFAIVLCRHSSFHIPMSIGIMFSVPLSQNNNCELASLY